MASRGFGALRFRVQGLRLLFSRAWSSNVLGSGFTVEGLGLGFIGFRRAFDCGPVQLPPG